MKICALLTLALSGAATAGALAQAPPARPDTTFFDAGWHHVGPPDARVPRRPGGPDALPGHARPLPRPADKTQPRPAGQVPAQFVVDSTGSVVRPVVLKSLTPACDAGALRAVAGLPRWKPGRRNGEPVAVRFAVPFTFHP